MTPKAEHLLRHQVATDITRHLIPCPTHRRVPQWATCPTCAWNTALIRAYRVAGNNPIPPPPTTWPEDH